MLLAIFASWPFWFFLLAPDLALLAGMGPHLQRGQLNPRVVPLYNAVHRLWPPFALAAVIALSVPGQGKIVLLGGPLAWLIHILADRALGFGLRDAEGFQRRR